jgi:glycosyltransferase involved in cell wall biosynthesis
MFRLAILASHVIQYQDPFFRLLAGDPEIDLTVIYCSLQGAQPYRDEDMKTTLSWDLEMLQGYSWRALRNFGRGSGYWRLVNPGVMPAIWCGHYDAVLLMLGWGTITSLLAVASCRAARIPIAMFGDSSFVPPEDSVMQKLRAGFFRGLFRLTGAFMISGTFNAGYYRHYGADPRRFFDLPWAIDNERFADAARFAPGEREALRERYGIAPESVVFLFSAKLIPRKDPMSLMRAFEQMPHRGRAALVYMGEGELRPELEMYVRTHDLKNVYLIGFVNQSEIPKHYAMADTFVLPSLDDPRGTVINEAMACGLPVVVTDRCGPVGDIVRHGDNGFVFRPGDVDALAADLDLLASDDSLRQRMSERSHEIIADWNYARGAEGVKAMLRWVVAGERP